MIAEYERAQILERSRRGKRHRAHSGEISVMSGAPYGYRYIRKTDEAPLTPCRKPRLVSCGVSMRCIRRKGSASARLHADSTLKVFRLAKRVLAGNARLSGLYCATPLIAASPASARRAPLRGPALCAHSVGGVSLCPA